MKLIFIILLFLFYKIPSNLAPFQFQHDLIPNDPSDYIGFGSSLSISGNTLAIGSSLNNPNIESKPGRAYIFEYENNNWNQKARLNINDGTNGDGFGWSISISNDIVVVGAPFANVSSNISQGKAYIFKKNGTDWNQVAELIASDGEAEDQFGYSVFISGKTIAISSPNADGDVNLNQGCVYIFNGNEDGTIWNQTQKLFASDGEWNNLFGFSISISNDSNIMIIGAPQAFVGYNNYKQGKAYIFQRNGTIWNETQILISNDGQQQDEFGYSVSISNDSSLILIGASYANVGTNLWQGKAYIFQKNGTIWNQSQILIASDGKDFDQFGYSVSISNDSSLILIGAPYAPDSTSHGFGKVYIYQKNGTDWNQVQILAANNGYLDSGFGNSIFFSENFALIGAPQSNSKSGLYVYSGLVGLINNIPLPETSSSSLNLKNLLVVILVVIFVMTISIWITCRLYKKKKKTTKPNDYQTLFEN